MKPGRNATCPCGSGKKFKCCPCGAYEATQFPELKRLEAEHTAYETRMAALTAQERRATDGD